MAALTKLEERFTEETYTRKPLINYTVKYFTELTPLVTEIKEENALDEAHEMASAQLNRNSQHIAALYVAGICNFEKADYSDTHLERLLSIFKNIKKWAIVEYIAQRILEYKEMDYALRYLASYYQVINKEDQAVDIWERLIKYDKENYELPERIAHIKERDEDLETALEYYKIALERNIAKKRDKVAETNLKKIFDMEPDCYAYMKKIESPLAEVFDGDAMVDAWKPLFFYYFDEQGEYEKALLVLKRILSYEHEIVKKNNKKAKFFRHRLVDTYQKLYAEHSVFEEFAELANLTNVYKAPEECMEAFEKHIQYDVKKYVYHRNFGVGVIKAISPENVIIDFKNSPEHRMTFDMVLKSVGVLEEEDIKVYKAYKLKKLKRIADEDPNRLITMVLRFTIGERISSKELKHELTPDVIPENQYNKWLDNAKKAVRAHNDLKFVKNAFIFKQSSMTYDEEVLDTFTRAEGFDAKFQTYLNYANYAKDINCTESKKMAEEFVGYAKQTPVTYEVVKSVFILNEMKEEKGLTIDFSVGIDDVIKDVVDYVVVYEKLPTAAFRERWVNAIIRNFPDSWFEIVNLFLYVPQVKNHHIITGRLIQLGKVGVLAETINDIILKYKEYTESFLYFAMKLLENDFDHELSEVSEGALEYNKELLFVGLLNLIPHLNKLMEKKENLTQNRKMLKTVYDLLFEQNHLLTFIKNEDEARVGKVFVEFKKLINIETHYKTAIITAVAKRFPNLN